MEISTITTTMLTASEGHILTDGEVYGKIVYLASDREPDEFYEITEEEYEAKTAEADHVPKEE